MQMKNSGDSASGSKSLPAEHEAPVARMKRSELIAKLRALGKLPKEQRNEIVCALIGHSRIQTACFGYYYCGRCNHQLGDTLGSVYPGAERAVIVGHECETCRANYAECTWSDKLYAPVPFSRGKKRSAGRKDKAVRK